MQIIQFWEALLFFPQKIAELFGKKNSNVLARKNSDVSQVFQWLIHSKTYETSRCMK